MNKGIRKQKQSARNALRESVSRKGQPHRDAAYAPMHSSATPLQKTSMACFFGFFVLSGFCGLVYQVVWLRISMADFGVTTPLISIVLSVFMAGLAVGSWGAGHMAQRLRGRGPDSFLKYYAITELLIGVSGIVVAPLLSWGRELLGSLYGSAAWSSGNYYLASAFCVAGALLPFCICMGATYPLAMAGIRAAFPDASPRSFSYLYIANVLGAMAGALSAAFILIEILGFHKTLFFAAGINATVAVAALILSGKFAAPSVDTIRPVLQNTGGAPKASMLGFAFLFATGLVSLALEVIWTRQFVPFLGPLVYSFAIMLAAYLAATVIGSRVYRYRMARSRSAPGAFPWVPAAVLAGSSGLFALLAADPRLPLVTGMLAGTLRVVLGIAPFCGVLGYLTPMMVDRISSGDPDRAGTAYAVNTLGCIIGPLLSGFVLLPLVGERWSTVFLLFLLFAFVLAGIQEKTAASRDTWKIVAIGATAAAMLIVFTEDFEKALPDSIVKRDHTATVIASGRGMQKRLLVNGYGMTTLNPITKMMVHLTLVSLDHYPKKGLVLCFGMGTSFRSMLTWGIPTTAVELVPSIPSLIGFYHADGEDVARNPLGRIVVDDARRFLDRSNETFDAIVIDPPPPVEAAASSLLYSSEFYEIAKRRLAPNGILQQWLPEGELVVVSAEARALAEHFRYIRVFNSIGGWGLHFLASDNPIPLRTVSELSAHMPETAVHDMLEWGPEQNPEMQFMPMTQGEFPIESVINVDPKSPILTDDRPVNEYYFLRRLLQR
jgi:spermidine synthase